MVEFDDQVRRDLAKLRARAGPPAAVKQRMFAALELELGGGGGGGGSELGGGGSAPAGAGGLAYATKLVAVTVALTAAGVLVLQLGVRGARALASKPSAPVVATEPPAKSSPGPAAVSEPTRPNSAESSSAPEPESALQPAGEALSPQGSVDKAAPTSAAQDSAAASEAEPKPEAGAPLDTLDAELELVNAARGAASPAAALEALERHLERFPAGQLSAERDLLRVEALCALGRLEAADTIRERFARQHPDSPHASRMRAACDEQAASE